MSLNTAVIFLDRDGTLIEDLNYPREPEKVVLIPKVLEALKLMRAKGYSLFVISNQSGVGRGIIKDQEFKEVHQRFCELLKAGGVELEGFAYCLHHPDDHCGCRKPEIGLVPKTLNQSRVSFADSYTVGDKLSDLELADNLGCKGCLVLSGYGKDTLSKLNDAQSLSKYSVFQDLLEMAKALPDKTSKMTQPSR